MNQRLQFHINDSIAIFLYGIYQIKKNLLCLLQGLLSLYLSIYALPDELEILFDGSC